MIVEVEKARVTVARAWLGELPALSHRADDVLCGHVDTSADGGGRPASRAGLELFVPQGGRAQYGTLAAEFLPSDGVTLSFRVLVGCGERIRWSLCFPGEDVRAGIPAFYAPGVAAVAGSASAAALGAGLLQFAWGAYGEVSSSPLMFCHLARAVVALLARDPNDVSEAEIAAFSHLGG